MEPPIHKDLRMDTPPRVPRDPVVPELSVGSVVFVILMRPERLAAGAVRVPPRYRDFAIDTPPVVQRDPVLPVLSVASVVSGMDTRFWEG